MKVQISNVISQGMCKHNTSGGRFPIAWPASEAPKVCVKTQIFRHYPRSKESNLQEDGTQGPEFLTPTLGDSEVPSGWEHPSSHWGAARL